MKLIIKHREPTRDVIRSRSGGAVHAVDPRGYDFFRRMITPKTMADAAAARAKVDHAS